MSAVTRVALPRVGRGAYSMTMDPLRLKPAVELPVRRGRPLALGAALALLFAFGARNYVASMHPCRYAAARPMVRLDLASEPPGATVVRERDRRTMCVTPCSVVLQAERGVAGFRFVRDGYADRHILVDMAGGDTQIETVLSPSR